MKPYRLFILPVLFAICCPVVFANSPPVVSSVTASQRTDGSKKVDIRYNLTDADGDNCTVSVQVSDDGGSTWNVAATSFSGDIGSGIKPGTGRHIVWDCGKDLPGAYGTNYRIKVTADDMVWVYINDLGFTGYMSKYETTNAQYCEFLNAALASGDIFVSGGGSEFRVGGANGTNPGADFVGKFYCYTASSSLIAWSQITYSGGSFSVRSRDGYSMNNHPVVEVSWYGATAFCNYYGYRLPTEWEWQAVADYDGSYTYGCGTTINQSKANYDGDNPLNLSSYPYTSLVGYYPAFGYGLCDMAGNVWEWTDSWSSGSHCCRVFRGGSWGSGGINCSVSSSEWPSLAYIDLGFRVVLSD